MNLANLFGTWRLVLCPLYVEYCALSSLHGFYHSVSFTSSKRQHKGVHFSHNIENLWKLYIFLSSHASEVSSQQNYLKSVSCNKYSHTRVYLLFGCTKEQSKSDKCSQTKILTQRHFRTKVLTKDCIHA